MPSTLNRLRCISCVVLLFGWNFWLDFKVAFCFIQEKVNQCLEWTRREKPRLHFRIVLFVNSTLSWCNSKDNSLHIYFPFSFMWIMSWALQEKCFEHLEVCFFTVGKKQFPSIPCRRGKRSVHKSIKEAALKKKGKRQGR